MSSFFNKLKNSIKERPVMEWTTRPEVLMLPRIPKPLHGVAPRVVLGDQWWNQERQKAYKSTNYHCIACGIHKTDAKGPKWLEAHEVYRTNYIAGRLYYVEAVPLCHFCHNSIHVGRLEALLDKHLITQQRFAAIVQHGQRVLAKAGLIKPKEYEGPIAKWGDWRLVLFGKMYKPRYKSLEDWAKHYGVEDAED